MVLMFQLHWLLVLTKCGVNAVVTGLCATSHVFEDWVLNMQNDFFFHTAAYFSNYSGFFPIENGVHTENKMQSCAAEHAKSPGIAAF